MSNRWWLFLIVLCTIVLIGAVPFLFSITVESPVSFVDHPTARVTSVALIEKKPLLDWTGRLTRYEVEMVVDGQPKRYAWSRRGWSYVQQADGVHQIVSTDGAVIIPLPGASK